MLLRVIAYSNSLHLYSLRAKVFAFSVYGFVKQPGNYITVQTGAYFSGFNRFSAGPFPLSLSPCLCLLSVSLCPRSISAPSPPPSLFSLYFLYSLSFLFFLLSLSLISFLCLYSLSLSCLCLSVSLFCLYSLFPLFPLFSLPPPPPRLSRIPPLPLSFLLFPSGKKTFTLSVSLSLSAFPPVHLSLCLVEQLRQTQSKTILSIRRAKLSVQCTFYDCRNSFA